MKHRLFFSKHAIKHGILGLLLEFGPVIVFLLAFEFFHVYKATIILMIATIISTLITFRVQKRLPYVALYVALLTSAFGYITLVFKEPKFIQMRDTLYDVTCAGTLLVGLMFKTQILKLAFHGILPMTKRAWNNFTYAWITFFLVVAVLNEYVRRTMSLDDWFSFKSIMVGVTMFFGLLVFYVYYEKELDDNDTSLVK